MCSRKRRYQQQRYFYQSTVIMREPKSSMIIFIGNKGGLEPEERPTILLSSDEITRSLQFERYQTYSKISFVLTASYLWGCQVDYALFQQNHKEYELLTCMLVQSAID